MALIKSHSNYVLKKKHQTVSDGTIWERDITTIGRVNFFAPGQQPIFRDNNFIITVRNDNTVSNQYNRGGWKDGGNGDIWTLQTISAITSDYDDQNDTKIVLKQDYYDFCDFAYYGSLSELFRASITDILARFPGELYGSKDNVYYTSGKTINGEWFEEEKILGGSTYYEVKNPFGIDIYSEKVPIGKNPLKYFAEDGYKEYEYFSSDSATPVAVTYSRTPMDTCAKAGAQIGKVKINGNTIYVYAGNNGSVHYLCKNSGFHIRPKKEPYIADFYNGCDNFQKLLMNSETTPKYKAVFSVISEDDYGYHRELKTFIFPTSEGGYNIDASSYGFNNYTSEFSRIGEYYDERFTDNLWRSMTHEAIKNFDWTHTREYEVGDEEEYVLGGEKMQKALRIFAREFDEIKTYIDNITSINMVTYDERGNVPNYFLTDVCENEGWDIIQVIPFDVTLNDCICYENKYVQNTKNEVKPYNTEIKGKDGTDLKNGYFISCCSGDGTSISDILCEYEGNTNYYVKIADENQSTFYDDCANKIRRRIKSYTDTGDTYTYMDVNNEFLRRLKLNSRYIWRHKGTQEGIEMILAMFGLKSKRWYDRQEACTYKKKSWDYDIKEYTRFSTGLTDTWDSCHNMFKYDWVNSTKTITYDYRTTSAYNAKGAAGINYIPYQGLPVGYVDKNENTRQLYPKFNSDEQYDGNPYFQMNGGWLSKKVTDGSSSYGFQYDIDNVAVFEPKGDIYKETIRNIRRVENLHDLLAIPASQVKTNTICFVENLNKEMLVVDGEAFDISVDSSGKKFVILRRSGGMIKVGDKYFNTNITVYGNDGNLHTYDLVDKLDGYPVNAYIKNGNSFHCSDGAYSIDLYRIFTPSDNETESNYFILNDESFSNTIALNSKQGGWERLNKNSYIYKKINTIWNYYKGNNPHTGNLSYDSGEEYYEYFKHIFKYAYDNSQFDERCFNDYYNEIDKIYTGAVMTISDDKEDTKTHYFGNYKGEDGYYHIYGEKERYQYPCTADTICGEYDENGSVKCDSWKCFYNTNKIEYYQIDGLFHIVCLDDENNVTGCLFPSNKDTVNITISKDTVLPEGTTKVVLNATKKTGSGWSNGWFGSNGKTISKTGYYHKNITVPLANDISNELKYIDCRTYGEIQPHTSTDSITNQIINNKRFTINFNIDYYYHTENGQAKLKFIDGIIMNYLTQLIPSSTIVDVKYEFKKPTEETSTEGLPSEEQINICCERGCNEPPPPEECPNMIDLGLPSGTKWGQYPVGTDENYNTFTYFIWGHIDEAHEGDTKAEQPQYEGDKSQCSSYRCETELDDDHDAVVEWCKNGGCKYRMPTHDEAVELVANCNAEHVTNYNGKDVDGWLLTSQINGNELFLPEYGELYPPDATHSTWWKRMDIPMTLWTRSGVWLAENNPAAHRLVYDGTAGPQGYPGPRMPQNGGSRKYGCLVIPVCNK